MKVRFAGSRLFIGDKEVNEFGYDKKVPAHYHKIVCVGHSPDEASIISADAGGTIKVWDVDKDSEFDRNIWTFYGFMGVTALGLSDTKTIAVAFGLKVVTFKVMQYNTLVKVGEITLPLTCKVVAISFSDNDSFICYDTEGKPFALQIGPPLQVKVVA